MIQLEALYFLKEVAKTHSINKAANSFYVSKSTFVSALDNLEDELGIALLQRTNYGSSLTEAGEAIMPQVEKIIADITELNMKCQNQKERNLLTLLMDQTVSRTLFSSVVMSVYEEANTQIQTMTRNCLDDILEEVDKNMNTLGFFVLHDNASEDKVVEKYSNIKMVFLNSFEIRLVCAKNSKFIPSDTEMISMEIIEKIPKVMLTCERYPSKDNIIYKNTILTTDSRDVCRRFIADDLAVGYQLMYHTPYDSDEDGHQLQYIPFAELKKIKFYLAYNRNFSEELIDRFRNQLSKRIVVDIK